MKYLITPLCVMFLSVTTQAVTLKDMWTNVRDETKITILESATPAYFYDIGSGMSKGGAVTPVAQWRFLKAEAGWITPFDKNKVGSALIGGAVDVDWLVVKYVPNLKNFVTKIIPKSSEKFWGKLSIGFFTGHDFDQSKVIYGVYSGLEFKFR